MINKIDPILYNTIKTESFSDNLIDCVVFSNNFNLSKMFLKKLFKRGVITELPFISAFGLKLSPQEISSVANLANTKYVSSSLQVQTQIDVSKKIIELNDVNLKRDFTSVVIDTGITPTLDLCVPNNRLVKFIDYVNNANHPYDDNGHGTFITGILAGNGLVSVKKFAGIDKNCRVIVIKALDDKGETGVINILRTMQWVLDNKRRYNIRLVCMSFGSMVLSANDPLVVGAEVLWNNGVCVVAAAGNSGPEVSSIKSPGASTKIITVGALNDNRLDSNEFDYAKFEVADFSSRGPILNNYKPDIIAPGVEITGACSFALFKEHYRKMSGTSVATPIVAGVCSLLIAKNERLRANEIKHILINNTMKISDDRNSEGFGIVNCRNFIF